MHITNKPAEADLPSTVQLLKSTAIAAIAALLLLLIIVMPAEYGVDPTGLGSITGLTRMGETKMALADEAAAEERALAAAMNQPLTEPEVEPAETQELDSSAAASAPAEVAQSPTPMEPDIRSDEMQVSLAPGVGREIKVTMAQGKTVEYSWQSEGGIANFDIHGDSVPLEIDYHNYSRGAEQSSSGVLEAAFDGNHGWFWRNRTDSPIVVTIQTRGEYTDIFLLD
ncbi:transmembrane anchor protein [Pseudohongiella sp.]|uniref:Transmembrane anchor protein n=1 Tax=marine sediment metagenome TaxID=412755 RepID=A0A0F9W8B6_9ZZZZ|nr:transmembrane anchor protein [Pseudohongiella sp.]HDZ09637.1 transmembrane anchor protein [Pseudohongiella sp.]HEA61826.1 transmembrane anchor protein [Pseudohongiella sp.]